ncbi:MAG: 23S rRNA (guanosine(2251)-2'-O)-methyltransferase RlmB [Bacteroidota bacterium]
MPDQEELVLIYGTRAVIEAIRSGSAFERVYLQQGLVNPLMRELRQELHSANIHYQMVPQEKLNRMIRGNHQGVVAYQSPLEYASVSECVSNAFQSGKVPLFLILDRITDTRNLGAIARTAECAGVDALILPSRGSALINGDAIKTSAGALNHLPVCREDNLKDTIDFLKESGIRVVACSEKGRSVSRAVDFSMPLAIIMGSEENGVSPEYMKRCDEAVKLPMAGNVSSYNVSVATGMILYEVMCQRKSL